MAVIENGYDLIRTLINPYRKVVRQRLKDQAETHECFKFIASDEEIRKILRAFFRFLMDSKYVEDLNGQKRYVFILQLLTEHIGEFCPQANALAQITPLPQNNVDALMVGFINFIAYQWGEKYLANTRDLPREEDEE